jgi:8-oxo-dGTP diphosphatase
MAPTAPEAANDEGCAAAGSHWRGEALLSARLKLRRPEPRDAEALARIANDPEVARWTADLPHPYDTGAAEAFIAKSETERQDGKAVRLLMERTVDGQLAGVIGIEIERGTGTLGYWIAHEQWGQGLATEATRRLLRLAFATLKLDEVRAFVMAGNQGSSRVLSKAGMRGESASSAGLSGRCRESEVKLYRITRPEWLDMQHDKPLVLVVAAALIDADGRVLLAQRPEGKPQAGLWEFPGGKVHIGESPEAALVRELKEELGIDTSESCLAPIAFASHDYDSFHLLMPLYAIRQWKGSITPNEGQRIAWARPAEMGRFPMPPADPPLIALLKEWV